MPPFVKRRSSGALGDEQRAPLADPPVIVERPKEEDDGAQE